MKNSRILLLLLVCYLALVFASVDVADGKKKKKNSLRYVGGLPSEFVEPPLFGAADIGSVHDVAADVLSDTAGSGYSASSDMNIDLLTTAGNEAAKPAAASAPVAKASEGTSTNAQPSSLAYSLGRASLRSGITSATKAALSEFPLVLKGEPDKYAVKVASSGAFGAARGLAMRLELVSFKVPKAPLYFAGLMTLGSIAWSTPCRDLDVSGCLIAAGVEVTKFVSLGVLIKSVPKVAPGLIEGAVAQGVGGFAIESLLGQVRPAVLSAWSIDGSHDYDRKRDL